MDMGTIKDMSNISNWSKKDVLNALGLESTKDSSFSATESLLPMLGVFAAGLLTGIGAGLLLAPKSGSEMRDEITERASSARDRASETVRENMPAH
jgi:hypothetical protein